MGNVGNDVQEHQNSQANLFPIPHGMSSQFSNTHPSFTANTAKFAAVDVNMGCGFQPIQGTPSTVTCTTESHTNTSHADLGAKIGNLNINTRNCAINSAALNANTTTRKSQQVAQQASSLAGNEVRELFPEHDFESHSGKANAYQPLLTQPADFPSHSSSSCFVAYPAAAESISNVAAAAFGQHPIAQSSITSGRPSSSEAHTTPVTISETYFTTRRSDNLQTTSTRMITSVQLLPSRMLNHFTDWESSAPFPEHTASKDRSHLQSIFSA